MPPAEAVAHDEVCAPFQWLDEWVEIREVVAVVRVTHDDELSTGVDDPAMSAAP